MLLPRYPSITNKTPSYLRATYFPSSHPGGGVVCSRGVAETRWKNTQQPASSNIHPRYANSGTPGRFHRLRDQHISFALQSGSGARAGALEYRRRVRGVEIYEWRRRKRVDSRGHSRNSRPISRATVNRRNCGWKNSQPEEFIPR